MTKNYNELPVIFVFDMDKTLIGDVEHLWSYNYLLDFIKDSCRHKRLVGPECKINTKLWVADNIPETILRPHLKESLHEIKNIFPTAEFFVFSLGVKEYVHNVIPYIEKQTGIKFNRPLFTREDSSLTPENNYLKDINGYYDIIFKTLSKKYPQCKDVKYQNKIIKERTVIIDDTNVWGDDDRWVQCNAYTYKPVIELDKKMLEIIYKNPEISTYIKSNRYIDTLPSVDITHKSFEEFLLDYHIFMSNLYRSVSDDNKIAAQDQFFISFVKAIKKRNKYAKPFDPIFLQTLKGHFI